MQVKINFFATVYLNDEVYSINNVKEEPLLWENSGRKFENIKHTIPDSANATIIGAETEGRRFAKYFMPTWKRTLRKIYTIGNNDMRLAGKLARNRKWEEAREIWEFYAKSDISSLRKKCLYNLALYHEVNGDLIKAFNILRDGYDKGKNGEYAKYLQKISKRLAQKRKLNKSIIQQPTKIE